MGTHEAESLSASFREVMAGVCSPVSVVTAMDGDRPHGTTVSAFTSLSMDPPMILVSLDMRSDLLALVRERGRFGVNILGGDQAALALAFARKGEGKFEGVEWVLEHGVPILAGVPGWLVCDVAELVRGGDHMIALGRVVEVMCADGAPLTYYRRNFGTYAELEAGLARAGAK